MKANYSTWSESTWVLGLATWGARAIGSAYISLCVALSIQPSIKKLLFYPQWEVQALQNAIEIPLALSLIAIIILLWIPKSAMPSAWNEQHTSRRLTIALLCATSTGLQSIFYLFVAPTTYDRDKIVDIYLCGPWPLFFLFAKWWWNDFCTSWMYQAALITIGTIVAFYIGLPTR